MNHSPYKPLPGRGLTWAGRSRIWLGADHLLLVLARGYVENYRRFFFNDIQGIIVRRTKVGQIWNAVWSVLFGMFALTAILVGDGADRWAFASIAAPFGILLLVNLALGPTCACHIRTAVQTEHIPAVSRIRAAEKFIAQVEPLIVAAQGELPQEQFATELTLLQAGQFSSLNQPTRSDVPPVIS